MTAIKRLDCKDAVSDLPKRWKRLGEIAILGPDNGIFKQRHDFGRGVPIINVSDLYKSLELDLGAVERVEASNEEVRRYAIASGDLFFCRSSLKREGIGWCCYVREVNEPSVFDCHVMRVRVDPDQAIPEYVALYWGHPSVREEVIRNSRTATMTTMNQQDLAKVKIPLPPLPEQRRIATILKEQMDCIGKARKAIEIQRDLTTKLVDSYLRESLSNTGTCSISLRSCLTEVSRGVGAGWENYRVIGATRSGLAPSKSPVGKIPERYKLVDKGTIFYNPMRILIGSIGMVDEVDEPGITSPDYVVFKTEHGVLHPRWFYYWLRSYFGAAFIKTLARGAVRERLLFQRLAKAEILLPSWDTQVKVAEKLNAIAQLRQFLEEQLTATNDLPEKLLHRAFNGEL